MLKNYFKRYFKQSALAQDFITGVLAAYLRFAYLTIRWQYILPEGYSYKEFIEEKTTIFALWHNRLALGLRIFKDHKDIFALASPHSDGRIISLVIKKFGFEVIEGSSNKNAVGALKQIITKLSEGSKIVITPDGPRGPVYEINSSITSIAKKYNAKLVPVTCSLSKAFFLRSWDKLILPKFFAKGVIIIGKPLILTDDPGVNDKLLAKSLIDLRDESDKKVKALCD